MKQTSKMLVFTGVLLAIGCGAKGEGGNGGFDVGGDPSPPFGVKPPMGAASPGGPGGGNGGSGNTGNTGGTGNTGNSAGQGGFGDAGGQGGFGNEGGVGATGGTTTGGCSPNDQCAGCENPPTSYSSCLASCACAISIGALEPTTNCNDACASLG